MARHRSLWVAFRNMELEHTPWRTIMGLGPVWHEVNVEKLWLPPRTVVLCLLKRENIFFLSRMRTRPKWGPESPKGVWLNNSRAQALL